MTKEDLADFRVPLDVFIESSLVLIRTKPEIKLKILNALGIDVKNPTSKVDWESFLFLNKLLRYGNASNEEFIEYYCRFFDQKGSGVVTDQEFEALIDSLFGNGDEPVPGQEKSKNESVQDNLKYICRKYGVYQDKGLVDFNQLRTAFR